MKSPKMPKPPPPPPAPVIQMVAAQESEADLRKKQRPSWGATTAGLVKEVPLGTGVAVGKTLLGS